MKRETRIYKGRKSKRKYEQGDKEKVITWRD